MNINSIYLQSVFSLAAYAKNLIPGRPDTDALMDNDAGLSSAQATKFAESYNVVTQYNDTVGEGGQGTGLSATVFVDKTTHQLTLAIRGTELADPRDRSTGIDMLAEGMAYDR